MYTGFRFLSELIWQRNCHFNFITLFLIHNALIIFCKLRVFYFTFFFVIFIKDIDWIWSSSNVCVAFKVCVVLLRKLFLDKAGVKLAVVQFFLAQYFWYFHKTFFSFFSLTFTFTYIISNVFLWFITL